MIINVDCMQSVYLCSLIDRRIDRLYSELNHYEDRRRYVSYETYITKTSYYRHELQKISSVREKLCRAIAINSMSDILFEEFGIDTEQIVSVHDLGGYVPLEGSFDDDEFLY